MNEHLSPELLDGVRNRSLPVDRLLASMLHLDQCAQCRSRLAQPDSAARSLDQIRHGLETDPEGHLTYQQMEALLDGSATQTDRAAAQEHLAVCPRCHAEYKDLAPLAAPRRPPVPHRIRWGYYSGAAAIAAVLLLFLLPQLRWPRPDSPPDLLGGITLSPPYLAAVNAALTARRIEFPPVPTALVIPAGVLRGERSGETGFAPIEPEGVIVWSDRPRFRWRPLAEGARYVVSVHGLDLKPVARSEPTEATEWSPSEPLPRGVVYQWQVSSELDGRRVVAPAPPAPEARFQILETAQARELDLARSRYPNTPLLLAVLYARAGLRLEARRELDALVKAHPHSELARRLLESAGE